MNNQYANKIQLKLDNDTIEKTIDDYEILDYFPQLKLIKNCKYYFKKYPEYYFCYNYIFDNPELSEVDEAFEILLYHFAPIEKQNARRGDIISFHNIRNDWRKPDGLNCEHFAKISHIDKNDIKIISKWGIMGVFEGRVQDLPDGYGNTFVIWRRKNKNSPSRKINNVKEKIDSF